MNMFNNYGHCGCDTCQPKGCCDKCGCDRCACPAPVFSVETDSTDPTLFRYSVNGKTVLFDHTESIKAGETATSVTLDQVRRTLNHYGEKSTQTITAAELGSILHLADLGDVDANSIADHGLLVFNKESDCGEGCEGGTSGWSAKNPIEIGGDFLEYIIGSTSEGEVKSLMPPTDASKFSYLAWAAQGKAKWVTPTVVSTPPVKDGYRTRLWLDESTGEIVAVREAV